MGWTKKEDVRPVEPSMRAIREARTGRHKPLSDVIKRGWQDFVGAVS